MPNLRSLGAEAEDRAASYLLEAGYTIITRRHKTRRGELDIVALDGEQLVFVEVKYRRAEGYKPEESLGDGKITALAEAARLYLLEVNVPADNYRFDLIAIDGDGLRHHRDLMAP
jgi:putative endonuclease